MGGLCHLSLQDENSHCHGYSWMIYAHPAVVFLCAVSLSKEKYKWSKEVIPATKMCLYLLQLNEIQLRVPRMWGWGRTLCRSNWSAQVQYWVWNASNNLWPDLMWWSTSPSVHHKAYWAPEGCGGERQVLEKEARWAYTVADASQHSRWQLSDLGVFGALFRVRASLTWEPCCVLAPASGLQIW